MDDDQGWLFLFGDDLQSDHCLSHIRREYDYSEVFLPGFSQGFFLVRQKLNHGFKFNPGPSYPVVCYLKGDLLFFAELDQ